MITGVAHFSIPVTDVERSTRFYTDVLGMKFITSVPGGRMTFLDAAGVCIILIKKKGPINPELDDEAGVHHSFKVNAADFQAARQRVRDKGVEIFFEEDRQGGAVNGPRFYFRDPDGTVIEIIDLTSYGGDAKP